MKNSHHPLTRFSPVALILFIGMFSSCKNPGDPVDSNLPKSDTVYQEGIDTLVIFDPETQLETVEIRKYTDTIVNGTSLRSTRFSKE